MKICRRMCGLLSVVAFVAAMGAPGTAAGSVWVNDGCPAVGAAESDQCQNATDDDGDATVNDGCPAVAAAESGAECLNAIDDDSDGLVNDGCPAVAAAESDRCQNAADDDGDTTVNDGCPQVGNASEAGAQCTNATDDDMADDHGACCDTATNLCTQLTEPECKALGRTFRAYGTPCGSDGTCIPTLSEWGVVVMAMLVLTAGTIVVMRRRAAATT